MMQACHTLSLKQLTFADFPLEIIQLPKPELKYLHCASQERTSWGDCEKCMYQQDCSKLEYSVEESQESREEFLNYGSGCIGFSEEKLLCENREGIFCHLKKRIAYRCPIRHDGEPEADPSLEQMRIWKKEGLNPRNGSPTKPARKRAAR